MFIARSLACFSSAVLAAAAVAPAAAGEYDCLIEAHQTVEIRSPVEATISAIHVARGDFVRKGEILVTMESGAEKAALELAKARATQEGEMRAAQARVDLTKNKYGRAEDLYKKNFVSSTARDEAEAEYKLSVEQLRQAKEARHLAELEVKRNTELLSLRTIASPFTGVVLDKLLSPGEFASNNTKDPILKMAEIDPLNVEVIIPVALYGNIHVGSKGEVFPEKPISGKYTATVKVVDKVVDAASGTFGVRLTMPNPGGKIPAGIKCRVKFP